MTYHFFSRISCGLLPYSSEEIHIFVPIILFCVSVADHCPRVARIFTNLPQSFLFLYQLRFTAIQQQGDSYIRPYHSFSHISCTSIPFAVSIADHCARAPRRFTNSSLSSSEEIHKIVHIIVIIIIMKSYTGYIKTIQKLKS